MKQLLCLLITSLIVCASFEQQDTTGKKFHDDLLDHLVGKWNVSGVVFGEQAKLIFEAEWVLNHQFLRIYEKSEGNVPGTDAPFEAYLFIGYENYTKRYITHLLSAAGGECAQNTINTYKTGNEIKLVIEEPCVFGIERFIYQPSSASWKIESRELHDGKEGEVYLDLIAVAAKSSN